ncbi:MAG: DUF1385 domain-containing protein [Clostridia bacterium]|nr:DUF1385 domain-containing protein [Clostridia bacterium]
MHTHGIPVRAIQADRKRKKEAPVDIGGQAVLEGVMMKAPRAIAIAVRKPSGEIAVKAEPYTPLSDKHKWMGWPFVRGCVNMVAMLKMGMDVLQKATNMLGVLEEEPSKFEKWLAAKLGKGIDKIVMGVAMVLAAGLAVLLFMVLPNAAGALLNRAISSQLLVNLGTGVVRIVILIAYIAAMSLLPDLRRVFAYHGAEHKTVYCHEHKLPLTVENARPFSTLHPRCGTAFLLLVMVIAILLGAVSDQLILLISGADRLGFWVRFARGILLLPIVTGLSYEALKGLAHRSGPWVRALRWPGLMMQKLTTREPDDAQIEVAIAAMEAALSRSAREEARVAGKPVPEEAPPEPQLEPQPEAAAGEPPAPEQAQPEASDDVAEQAGE